MSQGGSLSSSSSPPPPTSGIETISGNTGAATGVNVNLLGTGGISAGGGLIFNASSDTITGDYVSFGTGNTFLGQNSGNVTLTTAAQNTGIGNRSLQNLTSSQGNSFLGYLSGQDYTDGSRNTGIGALVLTDVTSSTDNFAGGYLSLTSATGSFNTALGSTTATNVFSGSYNLILGYNSGSQYSGSESSNILIGNIGIAGESNKIHIGTLGTGNGQQNACFIGVPTTVTGNFIATGTGTFSNVITPHNNSVFIDAASGNDSTGTGTALNPWATITHALNTITDNTASKPYIFYCSGIFTENVALKPWINPVGQGYLATAIAGNITLSPSFLSASSPTICIQNILIALGGLNLSLGGGSGSSANIIFDGCFSNRSASFTGRGESDFLQLFGSEFTNNFTVTNQTLLSYDNIYDSGLTVQTSSCPDVPLYVSQGDLVSGDVNIVKSGTNGVSANLTGGAFQQSITVNGCAVTYDAISSPLSGFSLSNGGTATPIVITPASGGTGINNNTHTLTLAGNLATSGAFASTFTMTNTTTVTFPTTGTLATTTQIGNRTGTVVTSNLTQNSGTTNTTLTSASTTASFLYGAMTEVGFSRLCSITGNDTTHDSAWSATSGTLQSSTLGNGFNYLSFTAQANANTLIYTIPTSLSIGVYRVRYRLRLNNDCGIVDFAFNPNSLGYTIIRNQIDCYQASLDNGDGSLQFEDYFTITSAQTGTCLLRWIVNGQNVSSSGFSLFLTDSFQVLRLG